MSGDGGFVFDRLAAQNKGTYSVVKVDPKSLSQTQSDGSAFQRALAREVQYAEHAMLMAWQFPELWAQLRRHDDEAARLRVEQAILALTPRQKLERRTRPLRRRVAAILEAARGEHDEPPDQDRW